MSRKQTAVANLTVAGITRGNCYDVIDTCGSFIKVVLDDGTIGLRHRKAFDVL